MLVRLVDSHCLYVATLEVEPIARVYLIKVA